MKYGSSGWLCQACDGQVREDQDHLVLCPGYSDLMGEEDIDDEDIAMTQTEINTICPISKVEMKKPVKNLACGHVYDKTSIEAILRQRSASVCPVVGCPVRRPVRRDQLQEDKATKRAIAKKKLH